MAVVALAACSDPSDTVGPFTGPIHRFVIDRLDVPRDSDDANTVAADLDGDGVLDNKLGNATAVLATTNDLTTDAPSMFASGALAQVLEIQADSLESDSSVGVRFGAPDEELGELLGGSITAGVFTTGFRPDRQPGCCSDVMLPVFVNADPIHVPIDEVRLELVPGDAGGYEGVMRGGIPETAARDAAYQGLLQMFETEPERHLVFARGVDTDRDDVLSRDELDGSVISLLVAADIRLFGSASAGDDSVSFAFALHLTPCSADGTCPLVLPGPFVGCRDRRRNGLETDVDCGGPECQKCAAVKACSIAEDCQSNACDAGACRAPSCTDGVRDGYEGDIDCGGSCPACATGMLCAADSDCTSGSCSNGAERGTCQ